MSVDDGNGVWNKSDTFVFLPSMNNGTSGISDGEEEECGYETVNFDRFMLVIGAGTPLAVIGVMFNLVAFIIYAKPHHLHTSDLYFALLALLDTSFCTLYILLMTMDAISLHYGYISLFSFYITYSFPLFALGRMIQLSSVYMMVAATIERYLIVRKWTDSTLPNYAAHSLSPRGRLIVVLLILLVCVTLRAPSFWEYEVVIVNNCSDPFGMYQFESRLASLYSYNIFNFYIMNVIQVFVPFILLTVLNVSVTRTLRRRLSLATKFLFPIRYVSEESFKRGVSREKLKSATYTLIALVTGYLISNLFNMSITVMEYTAKEQLLLDEQNNSFWWYTLSSDISSVLTIANSCVRLPLYCLCSHALRMEFYQLFGCAQSQSRDDRKRANERLPLSSSTQFCEAC